jgi:hypothetical protein
MHLRPGVAKQPNLELKTQPKQLLGSLPLVIALPGQSVCVIITLILSVFIIYINSCNVCVFYISVFSSKLDSVKATSSTLLFPKFWFLRVFFRVSSYPLRQVSLRSRIMLFSLLFNHS